MIEGYPYFSQINLLAETLIFPRGGGHLGDTSYLCFCYNSKTELEMRLEEPDARTRLCSTLSNHHSVATATAVWPQPMKEQRIKSHVRKKYWQ